MNSIPCDIVLLPDDRLADKAISASRLLSDRDPLFTLKMGEFYPHMSLYMFQLDVDKIPRVEEVLGKVSAEHSHIDAQAARYSIGQGHALGYIDPEYEVTDQLCVIQMDVIKVINPLRAGMRESDIAKMHDARGIKLTNLQDYGYPAVGELFRPHITLTRLKEYIPEVLDVLPDINDFSGTFTKIGLFEMGSNGTCIRKISEFDLQS